MKCDTILIGDIMEPLAIKMRPKCLKDVVGQTHLIGKDKVLSNLVKHKKLFSMILYGKTGIGKTTIATAIVEELGLKYRMLNATINNKKDFDIVIEEAKMYGQLVVLIDEIHRLNKDKQDLLLPHLESGLIVLVGMTTANPFHSINPAIRSRCQLFELKELIDDDIKKAIKRAIKNELDNIKVNNDCLNFIITMASGDLRYAYNLLEVAYYSTDKKITIEALKNISNKPNVFYDKNDDGYYDTISAFQKSIRGSDVDASLHYLAKLLVSEDLDIIFRRMTVIAYEDIGLANPNMILKVEACIKACERIGLPEARIPLAKTVIEMALSPKSNSAYLALNEAINDVNKGNTGNVPNHIKTNSKDYKYAHDYPNHIVKQQYLPNNLKGKRYYKPQNNKNEIILKEINEKIKEIID